MLKILSGYNPIQSQLKLVSEAVAGTGTSNVYIQGPFQIANSKNQNGRVYPKEILFKEVERYKKEYVQTGRALGELDHADNDRINGDRISHRIVDLWVEGNVVMGKALILDTTLGKQVKAILEGGGVMGVSSRSLGDYDDAGNVTELHLICWDIVQDPSVASALMEKVNEKYEFRYDNKEKKFIKKAKIINKEDTNSVEMKRKIFEHTFEQFLKTL